MQVEFKTNGKRQIKMKMKWER